MKIARTEAIVLHTLAARERDKLVIFLTPDRGKIKGWAYGARGIKSRFGASLEPLAKVRIGYIEKEGDEVVRIESVDLIRSLFPAQQQLVSSIAASYIAETVDTFAAADDPNELIYRLLDRATEALLAAQPTVPIVAYAEIWILRLAGIFPSMRECMECGGALERPLRLDYKSQGFVCDNCATGDADRVSNDAADTLEAIFRMPVATFAERATPAEVLFEVRAIAGGLRRHFLGHELKSFEVLTTLLR